MNHANYQNWQLTVDQDHILWLSLNKKDASVNTLDLPLLNELEQILIEINQDKQIKGVVIQSAKSSGFIAGADIEQFTRLKNREEAFQLLCQGQEIFNKFASLPIPTVALIDGFCLGGGLELALACRYRVVENQRSKLGLPEVKLGIHPGWGGTIRLPKLIGAVAAMDLILTGRIVSGKTAKKIKLVDAAVPRRFLVKAAKSYLLTEPKIPQLGWLQRISNHPMVRPWLAKIFRTQLRKKINKEFYPAPYSVVDCWEKNGVDSPQAFIAEADSVANLQDNATAKNLIRVFFIQDRLKAFGKNTHFPVKHVHVIGAGIMGGDIAAWCAFKGFQVTLQDTDPQSIAKSLQRAYFLFKKKLKDRLKVQAAMDRLLPDVAGKGIVHADVIIEAIFENLKVKQELFKSLEQQAKPTAVLASNTSSIPLDDINQLMQNPTRLVGIHFFNPVAKMMLIEVVCGAITDSVVFDQALAFVHHLAKLALPVKSSPGFLVNRVLMPYLMEAMALLQEGVPAEIIDAAAVDFGMPMGPIQLADTVGLDVCLSVARNLTQHYGGEISNQLVEMVAAKQLGVKTGKGFYCYKQARPIKQKISKDYSKDEKAMISQRLVYRILNESIACLREKVVADFDLLDGGMIFGTGFAPFRGGPIQYAQSIGKDELLIQFSKLHTKFGERFKADAGWEDNTLWQ